MDRGGSASISQLKNVSSIVDEFGYESVLLVYHSKIEDNWIKAARVLDLNHKFKYMPAIRTYAITPEYCAMMAKAFSSIAPDRLMLNIVSGDLHKDETSVEDLIWLNDRLDTPEKRLLYTDEWLAKFIDLAGDSVSELVMGGHSDQTKLMAEKYNATHLSMLDMHKFSYNSPHFIKNKKQMLSLSIIINDSPVEINKMLSTSVGADQWTIYGDKTSVRIQLEALAEIGATDLMISPHPEDKNIASIHYLIKEMIGE
jgi:alkanesulfonate monooxygenase SsuD/methylene tetrahydromethanopterin reductase-like flavin-dependent oxidoreductase (luciferase family)